VKSAVHFRALLVCLVLVTGFSALSARLIYLQWIDRDTSAPKAPAEPAPATKDKVEVSSSQGKAEKS